LAKFVFWGLVFSEMKNSCLLLFLILITSSCNYFETEKISSDTFYEEELKTIDWKDVDQYPAFKECESQTEKLAQKNCFVTTLSEHIYAVIESKEMVASNNLQDTIQLSFSISKTGELRVIQMYVDSLISTQFPLLEDWMRTSVEVLPLLAPAYKRGIPVETEFKLPIVLSTGDL
jgi:hypothetical protein